MPPLVRYMIHFCPKSYFCYTWTCQLFKFLQSHNPFHFIFLKNRTLKVKTDFNF